MAFGRIFQNLEMFSINISKPSPKDIIIVQSL